MLLLLFTLGIAGALFWRQDISDWYRLQRYDPPARVAQVTQTTAMTDYGRRLLYVNNPVFVTGREIFAQKCPLHIEKTIVMGCYLGRDNGIYVYDVDDPRLKGVIETTTAHEMLHAGYGRLKGSQKEKVDAMLLRFANKHLKDERIKKTLTAYENANAEMTNEMHSIFATEVAELTPELETYYAEYFTDRKKVLAEMQRYQNEFTSREAKMTDYDTKLAKIKQDLDILDVSLRRQLGQLDTLQSQMSDYQAAEEYASYNGLVGRYNVAVDAYNTELEQAKALLKSHNEMVDQRNAIALEEQQLVKALSGDALPSKK